MNIGRRQRVENLRAIWPKETDFSDWLATEDGLALLAEDIGIEIEEPKRECRPGDFPCDVVGRKVGDENHVVVIENQFGKTNHDHLGKLLTYAAMNSAMTGIRLSEVVSDDHRQVIDWLNNITPPQVSFYLAEIRAYRIGDSPVAPQLDVVSRPNLEAKVQREKAASENQHTNAWRREVWADILDYIKSKNPPFRTQSPSMDHWSTITLGRSGFSISPHLLHSQKKISCDLGINPLWKDNAFEQLEHDKFAIEDEIGAPLLWNKNPGIKSARLRLTTDLDPKNPSDREAIKEWMYRQTLAFYRTFQPRVKKLQEPVSLAASDDEIEEAEEASAM